mmetsp:Transcript_21327/g.67084  ORF Transcript_21327/g.67084 Transcript_21327/m.67084 type:complete len:253 (+) Transcript_21327:25-783(+)
MQIHAAHAGWRCLVSETRACDRQHLCDNCGTCRVVAWQLALRLQREWVAHWPALCREVARLDHHRAETPIRSRRARKAPLDLCRLGSAAAREDEGVLRVREPRAFVALVLGPGIVRTGPASCTSCRSTAFPAGSPVRPAKMWPTHAEKLAAGSALWTSAALNRCPPTSYTIFFSRCALAGRQHGASAKNLTRGDALKSCAARRLRVLHRCMPSTATGPQESSSRRSRSARRCVPRLRWLLMVSNGTRHSPLA